MEECNGKYSGRSMVQWAEHEFNTFSKIFNCLINEVSESIRSRSSSSYFIELMSVLILIIIILLIFYK